MQSVDVQDRSTGSPELPTESRFIGMPLSHPCRPKLASTNPYTELCNIIICYSRAMTNHSDSRCGMTVDELAAGRKHDTEREGASDLRCVAQAGDPRAHCSLR